MIETACWLCLLVFITILGVVSSWASYRNGVDEGYGYATEPWNPEYQRAGNYLKIGAPMESIIAPTLQEKSDFLMANIAEQKTSLSRLGRQPKVLYVGYINLCLLRLRSDFVSNDHYFGLTVYEIVNDAYHCRVVD